MAVSVLCLLLVVLWIGLQCVIVAFPGHTHFLIQSKLFITSLVITEYSISDINLLGTDLFQLKFPLYNRIFT